MWKILLSFCLCLGIGGASFFDYESFSLEDFNENFDEDLGEIQPASYIVKLMKNSKVFCLGTIYGETSKNLLVATNAACANVPNIKVQIGTTEALIDKTFIHPYYEPSGNNYDIAVLKIKKPQKPVEMYSPLPTNEYLNLTAVQPSANDVVTLNGLNITNNLSIISVNATTENKLTCRNKFAGRLRVSEKMICVNYNDNISNFLLTGTPMIFKGSFAGILSLDIKNFPKIFTNIANSEIYSFLDQFL